MLALGLSDIWSKRMLPHFSSGLIEYVLRYSGILMECILHSLLLCCGYKHRIHCLLTHSWMSPDTFQVTALGREAWLALEYSSSFGGTGSRVNMWLYSVTLIYVEIWRRLPGGGAFLKKSLGRYVLFSLWEDFHVGLWQLEFLAPSCSQAKDGQADRWREAGTGRHHWAVEFANSGPPCPTAGALGFVRER